MHPYIVTRLADDRHQQLLHRHPGGRPRTHLRPLEPTDERHIAALFERLSPQSRYLRYLAPVPRLTQRSLRRLAAIDHDRHEAVGAFEAVDLIGSAHLFRLPETAQHAEIAVEVADTHQRRGVGTRLLVELRRLAVERGITHFVATAFRENHAVLAMLRRGSWPAEISWDGSEMTIAAALADARVPAPRLGSREHR